jgi:hypothetical protein
MAGIEDAQHLVVVEDLVQAAAVVTVRVGKVIKIPGVLTEAGSLFVLVAGTGFEPATSGL